MRCNADDYRNRAKECEAVAEIFTSSSARLELLELADGWRAMAEHLDEQARLSRDTTRSPISAAQSGSGGDYLSPLAGRTTRRSLVS